MRKCLSFIALLAACLTLIGTRLGAKTYQVVSREFTVSQAEASSSLHTRQFLSREFTVGMGEATNAFHTRDICSREFTIGIGNEIVDIWPFQEKLAGTVVLENGSQFLQDMQDATLSCRIHCNNQTLVMLEKKPLETFSYTWDTSAFPDGVDDSDFFYNSSEHLQFSFD